MDGKRTLEDYVLICEAERIANNLSFESYEEQIVLTTDENNEQRKLQLKHRWSRKMRYREK